MEFCALRNQHMAHLSTEVLDLAVQNMKLAQVGTKKRNIAYWTAVASTVEGWARFVVPAFYFLGLAILFHTDFSDEYLTRADASMYAGIGKTEFSTRGVVLVILYVCALSASLFGYLMMKQIDQRRNSAKDEAQANIFKAAGKEKAAPTFPQPLSV